MPIFSLTDVIATSSFKHSCDTKYVRPRMHIPTEICQTIIRAATCVPEAFDSSFDSILHEDRESVVKAIQKSMSTKAALSLVSKLFHELAEEFLYEIIFVSRFDHIPHLTKLLQSQPNNNPSHKAYGLHCRRLEISLGTGAVDYKDQAWDEGGHVLWGLIPACPNVTVLICRVWRRIRPGAFLLGCPKLPHVTNPVLWKIIASTCGPHLRRLELFGLSMRMDHTEMLLRYCTKLEVCHLVHVRPLLAGGETCDVEEFVFPQFSCIRSLRHVVHDEKMAEPSGFFDQETRESFAKYKTGVPWPPCLLGPPYSLPFLHTLHIDQFTPRITQLDISNVRSLRIRPATASAGREISSTNWSSATSLTHLSYCGYPVSLQTFLDYFPNIKELSLHYGYEQDVHSIVTKPHLSLSVIKFCSVYSHAVNLHNHVADLLSVAQSKMLPSLTSVLIMRGRIAKDDGGLPWGKFRTLGITLRVKVVKPSGRYKVDGQVQMPDYTFRE